MSAGLLEQLDTYFDQVDAGQTPVTEAEVKNRLVPVPLTRPTSSTRRRGVLVALAAALLVLLIGVVPFLLQRDAVPSADTVDPTPTSIVTETTVAPLTTPPPTVTPELGFAPTVTGLGVGSGAFGLASQEFEVSGGTLTVWEAELTVDWMAVAMATADEEARQALSLYGIAFAALDPDSGVVSIADDRDPVEFARFALDFNGTSDQWVVDVVESDTGNRGSISGSLPGLSEGEILSFLTGWHGTARWFFVSDGDQEILVTPPWSQLALPWENDQILEFDNSILAFDAPLVNIWSSTDGVDWVNLGSAPWSGSESFQILVIKDSLLAFAVVDPSGPGQFNIWSSSDGSQWSDLGPAPWPGESFGLHTLTVRDEVVLAAVEQVGTVGVGPFRFWSSVDGSQWTELTRSEWDEQSGGIPVPDEDALVQEPADPPIVATDVQAFVVERFARISENATVIQENPLIVEPVLGPQPGFDTSSLGEEIVLETAQPGDQILDGIRTPLSSLFSFETAPPSGPILHLGQISGMSNGYHLYWPTDNNGFCSFALANEGAGCGDFGSGVSGIEVDRNQGDVVVTVPLDAAVVALRYNAEQRLWQRPTAGWAIFPAAVGGDDTFWVDVYDVRGNLIDTTEN